MNEIKTIINLRKINSDYFLIKFRRGSNLYLKDFIDKINFDDYVILKTTSKQRVISLEDFKQFKYSGYLFINKTISNIDNIMEWCKFQEIKYLFKPTPPFSPNKIIIKQ